MSFLRIRKQQLSNNNHQTARKAFGPGIRSSQSLGVRKLWSWLEQNAALLNAKFVEELLQTLIREPFEMFRSVCDHNTKNQTAGLMCSILMQLLDICRLCMFYGRFRASFHSKRILQFLLALANYRLLLFLMSSFGRPSKFILPNMLNWLLICQMNLSSEARFLICGL